MSSSWRQALVQDRLSAALLDQIRPYCAEDVIAELARPVTDKASLAALAAAAKTGAKKLPSHLAEALQDEIAEIKADAKWVGSKQGRYLLAINMWAEGFHREFRSRPEFADACLGGHVDKQVVFVTGKVRSQQVLDELLAYVASKEPPFKLLVEVTIAP